MNLFVIFLFPFLFLTFGAKADTLSDINAELNARKAASEPFDQKKVKVDLESLGLDNMDEKIDQKKSELKKEITKQEIRVKELPPLLRMIAPPDQVDAKSKNDVPKENVFTSKKVNFEIKKIFSKESKKISRKIADAKNKNYLRENAKKNIAIHKPSEASTTLKEGVKTESAKVKKTAYAKKITKKNKNISNVKRSKRELAIARFEADKKRKEKSRKLNILREKYLLEVNEKNEGIKKDPFIEDDERIIPAKKDISKFTSDEPPPPQLLTKYRDSNNKHIPVYLTQEENVKILFSTIKNGGIDFFNSAYKNVKDPNVKNSFGDTILTYSVLMQKYPIIASALANGANPNILNDIGYTPINLAIELQDIKSLQLLVDNNADVNYRDGFGRTYLMEAVHVGFLPAVELLLSKNLDVNAMDNNGMTALSIAYRYKKEIIVKYLLKHGAKTWVEKEYIPESQSMIEELENRFK